MYEQGSVISAEEINDLKAEVKAEMLRRNKTGTLATYGSTTWDYEITPQTGVKIEEEHFSKIKTPVSQINEEGLPSITDNQFPALDGLNGKLQTYKSYTGKTATTHGCSSSCSGLCYSSCTSCTSCTSCSGCSSCSGCRGCGSGCSGCSGCGSGCADSCDGCSGCSGCGSGCASSCYNNCLGCKGSCTGTCQGTCVGAGLYR